MANMIELRGLVKTVLNANVTDPLTSRRGLYFFEESDDFNFSRGNTFPKGYLQSTNSTPMILSPIGNTGYATHAATINIYYYVGDKQKLVKDGTTYKNQDLAGYIQSEIKTALLSHRLEGYHLRQDSFGIPILPGQTDGSKKYWFSVLPVTYYWSEKY